MCCTQHLGVFIHTQGKLRHRTMFDCSELLQQVLPRSAHCNSFTWAFLQCLLTSDPDRKSGTSSAEGLDLTWKVFSNLVHSVISSFCKGRNRAENRRVRLLQDTVIEDLGLVCSKFVDDLSHFYFLCSYFPYLTNESCQTCLTNEVPVPNNMW